MKNHHGHDVNNMFSFFQRVFRVSWTKFRNRTTDEAVIENKLDWDEQRWQCLCLGSGQTGTYGSILGYLSVKLRVVAGREGDLLCGWIY